MKHTYLEYMKKPNTLSFGLFIKQRFSVSREFKINKQHI